MAYTSTKYETLKHDKELLMVIILIIGGYVKDSHSPIIQKLNSNYKFYKLYYKKTWGA